MILLLFGIKSEELVFGEIFDSSLAVYSALKDINELHIIQIFYHLRSQINRIIDFIRMIMIRLPSLSLCQTVSFIEKQENHIRYSISDDCRSALCL